MIDIAEVRSLRTHSCVAHIRLVIILLLIFSGLTQKTLAQENSYSLGLVAYNYTNSHISNYSVNSVGGGNVFLSSATSGGSGVACCLQFQKNGLDAIDVTIRWQNGGCRYILRNDWTKETAELVHYFYKEREVKVARMKDGEPRYLETHFFADGSIQARITNSISDPQAVVRGASQGQKANFPRCKNDEKPR